MTETEDQPVAQNFRNCVEVYKIMASEADVLSAQQTGSVPMTVWEGFTTKLIVERMGLSVPYYSSIRRELIRMGCIKQLRRGGGTSPSQWELLREPTEELWHNAPAKRTYASSMQDAAAQQIADIIRRLSRLEENFDVLVRAVAEHGGNVPFDEPKPNVHQYEVISE
jgi:hypothetical protein